MNIKDGGHTYRVIETDFFEKEDNGYIDQDALNIVIRGSLEDSVKEECLFHELCHLAFYGTAMRLLFKDYTDETHEMFVDNFSQRLYGILRENNILKEDFIQCHPQKKD